MTCGAVVDGDTLLLRDGTRIRLMGVDTPETVKPDTPVEPWGPEASEFTRDFVAGGPVRLEFDRERTDRFGRHLAYVWVGNRMLNEELLRAGLARWEPGYHYSQAMKTRFRRAQREAPAGASRDMERRQRPSGRQRNLLARKSAAKIAASFARGALRVGYLEPSGRLLPWPRRRP